MAQQIDVEYEKQIIATSLKDIRYLQRAVAALKEYQFSNKQLDWIWKQIVSQYVTHHELMPRKKAIRLIKAEFSERSKSQPYMDTNIELFDSTQNMANTSMEELNRFIKHQHMKTAMSDAAELLKQGKVEDAWNTYREGAALQAAAEANREDWFSRLDERQAIRRAQAKAGVTSRVPSSVRYLDNHLDGGLAPGELGILIGVTSIGKSSMLVQFAYGAAVRGSHVLYVALEMRRDQIESKLDAKLTQIDSRKFKTHDFDRGELIRIERSKDRIQRMPKRILKDKLHVASVPVQKCDVNIIRGMIKDRLAVGIPTDLVVVDSGDHLVPIRRAENYRVTHTMAYWDMKGLAEECDCGVWSSTHAPKEYKNKIIWYAESVAESYDKARISDVAVTMGCTLQMRDITPYPELAMVLAKNRDGEVPRMWLKMQARYSTCTFIEIDELEKSKFQKQEEKKI